MEFKENDKILICYRVSDYEPPVQSHIETCVLCSKPVWRALSSPEVTYCICMQCGVTELEKRPNAKIEPPTERQLTDAERVFEIDWRPWFGDEYD